MAVRHRTQRLLEELRARRRHLRSLDDDDGRGEEPDRAPSPEGMLLGAEADAKLAEALAELGEDRRAALVMRIDHGLDYEEIATVMGWRLRTASGEVRLRTVSGDAQVTQQGNGAAKLEYGTTSGDLVWTGTCKNGCRIEARSTSGDVRLNMASDSSFDLRFVTHSGDVRDDLKMQTPEQSESHHGGGSLHARYGRGEGLVEAQTFSGDLHVARK